MEFSTIEEAIEEFRSGKMVIVVDDEDRENEGDFTIAAEKVTPDAINFMAKYGRGLICLPMAGKRLDELQLPLMVSGNTSKYGTAFTVSIEARHGVTTGISAADRATTILAAIHSETKPSDLARPGHVFPLRARPGGVLERAGQTEAAVDLARLSGLYPASVICEVMNEDGTMARVPELQRVAQDHGIKMITVAHLIAFRLRTETFVRKVAEANCPGAYGEFRVVVFENSLDGEHHVALVKGEIVSEEPILVRVQTQSTLQDVFDLMHGEEAEHIQASLEQIQKLGQGVLVYLRLEAKGGGLVDKIRSHGMISPAREQEDNTPLATTPDLRIYGLGAQILRQLGIRKLRLLTNHPKKIVGVQGYGLSVVEQVPLEKVPFTSRRVRTQSKL